MYEFTLKHSTANECVCGVSDRKVWCTEDRNIDARRRQTGDEKIFSENLKLNILAEDVNV